MVQGRSTNNSTRLPQWTCGEWIDSILFPQRSPWISTNGVESQLIVVPYIFLFSHVPCPLHSPGAQQIALQTWQCTENVDHGSRSAKYAGLSQWIFLFHHCSFLHQFCIYPFSGHGKVLDPYKVTSDTGWRHKQILSDHSDYFLQTNGVNVKMRLLCFCCFTVCSVSLQVFSAEEPELVSQPSGCVPWMCVWDPHPDRAQPLL